LIKLYEVISKKYLKLMCKRESQPKNGDINLNALV